MSDVSHIYDFLDPVFMETVAYEQAFRDGKLGKHVSVYENEFPDLKEADTIIIGCNEERGSGNDQGYLSSPDKVRDQLYSLFNWHADLKIADIGNIKRGATLADTNAALKLVIRDMSELGKTVIILGGSHDLTLAQYGAYANMNMVVDATCVDALMDLNLESYNKCENFLMEILTGEPNFIRHYNHIAFQSYFVHPHMLETMDKLRFDCYRLGHVKENIEEMEPVIRNTNLFSFDISAIANSFAPATTLSPNGLNGEEACMLMRFAGLSPAVNTIGIYGFSAEKDKDDLTAKLISQMLWYFFDGRSRGKREAKLDDKESFNEYHTAFSEVETTFLQSKKTGRWWMQLPDKKFIACSHNDYLIASRNSIPERWLRAQERM